MVLLGLYAIGSYRLKLRGKNRSTSYDYGDYDAIPVHVWLSYDIIQIEYVFGNIDNTLNLIKKKETRQGKYTVCSIMK